MGDRLLALVAEARETGVDPEQALRDAVRRLLAAGEWSAARGCVPGGTCGSPRGDGPATVARWLGAAHDPFPRSSTRGIHRSRRRPRDPRLARQPHRRGRGAPRRRCRSPGRRCRAVRPPARSRRSSCATAATATSARACSKAVDARDPDASARPSRASTPTTSGSIDQTMLDARRHAQQGQARCQRDPRRLARGRPRGGRLGRPAALPLRRRPERPPAAGADDEHPQRRRRTPTPTSTSRSS